MKAGWRPDVAVASLRAHLAAGDAQRPEMREVLNEGALQRKYTDHSVTQTSDLLTGIVLGSPGPTCVVPELRAFATVFPHKSKSTSANLPSWGLTEHLINAQVSCTTCGPLRYCVGTRSSHGCDVDLLVFEAPADRATARDRFH